MIGRDVDYGVRRVVGRGFCGVVDIGIFSYVDSEVEIFDDG